MKRSFIFLFGIFLFSVFFMIVGIAGMGADVSAQVSDQISTQINDDFVKWRQRPDMETGANIISLPYMPGTDLKSVADDWLCLDGSPVSDLHFWGSYPGWMVYEPVSPDTRPPGVMVFRIQIYSDAPATPPNRYSRPNKLLYEVWIEKDDFTETYVDSILPPWQKYEHKYRYDLDLPRMFWQKRDTVYWLNISAIPLDFALPWGWETSMDRWNDFAVQGWYDNPDNRQWNLIRHPFTEKFVNMSFELTACEGPIKWLQFPDMANGINIPSTPEHVVADDWLCTNGKPVTEVHFWGSYLSPEEGVHWQQGNPGPPESSLPDPPHPAEFKLSFHEDVPAGYDQEMPWSHPGDLIREVWLDIDRELKSGTGIPCPTQIRLVKPGGSISIIILSNLKSLLSRKRG